ncbi:hypothetical protein [Azomonas macrocytogenes]|uniref:Cytoskeletal protein RodZ n=1 Tax=Azomonas macrocytogenes TaxID=69962 RepID=A0A839T2E0_AZOMA|nr:hypothetical protein [Azomonas macrocytogenes]MBB3102544.1 cytoskeletal protein RodZ [Azomonas macrocytogenes]
MEPKDDVRRLMQHSGSTPDSYKEFGTTNLNHQASRWKLLEAVDNAATGQATSMPFFEETPHPVARTQVSAPYPPAESAPQSFGTTTHPPATQPATPAPAQQPFFTHRDPQPQPFFTSHQEQAAAQPPVQVPATTASDNPFGRIFRSQSATGQSQESQPTGSLKSLLKGLGSCR